MDRSEIIQAVVISFLLLAVIFTVTILPHLI